MSAAQALNFGSRAHVARPVGLRARQACTTRPLVRSAQAASGKLTIYTNPRSRSQIVEWYARELGVKYAVAELDMAAGAHKTPAYLQVHPFGQLPALTCEDGTAVFESGAVLLYLADKFGAAKTPEARGAAASWVVWVNSSFAPAVFGPTRAAKLPGLLSPLEAKLKASPYLLGDTFSVADCAVGAYLAYTTMFFPDVSFKPWPAVQKYLEAIEKRPHFVATIGSE